MRTVGIVLMCISAAIDVISFFKVMSIDSMKEVESFHRLLIIGTIAFFVGLVLTLVGRNKVQENQYTTTTESDSFSERLSSISANNDSKWCCKHCGQWNEKSLTICLNCGEKKAVKTTPKIKATTNEWECINCGKINQNYVGTCGCGQTRQDSLVGKRIANHSNNKEWKCSKCGKINQNYIGTCGCGQTKQASIADEKTSKNSSAALDDLKKYKELLDMGAITQEEYDTKKKELLNL